MTLTAARYRPVLWPAAVRFMADEMHCSGLSREPRRSLPISCPPGEINSRALGGQECGRDRRREPCAGAFGNSP